MSFSSWTSSASPSIFAETVGQPARPAHLHGGTVAVFGPPVGYFGIYYLSMGGSVTGLTAQGFGRRRRRVARPEGRGHLLSVGGSVIWLTAQGSGRRRRVFRPEGRGGERRRAHTRPPKPHGTQARCAGPRLPRNIREGRGPWGRVHVPMERPRRTIALGGGTYVVSSGPARVEQEWTRSGGAGTAPPTTWSGGAFACGACDPRSQDRH